MEEKEINKEEIKELLSKQPELVSLTQEQKEGFLYIWKTYPSYKARQKLVGTISNLYCNRRRYRDLLTDKKDVEMFDRILLDGGTPF